MTATLLQVARLVAVVALVLAAAALATPPGRLPLAVRGIQRILRRDAGRADAGDGARPVASPGRRAVAFLLVLAAIALAFL